MARLNFSAIALTAALTACTTNPVTGEKEPDWVAVFDGLTLAASVLVLTTSDEDDPPPDLIALAADGAEEGIRKYCLLDEFDRNTVRRALDEQDPKLRPHLVLRYGGADGDVCTEE